MTRAGDASGTATVNLQHLRRVARPDHASQKSDYEIALGKLTFAPGETSKTFRILIVNDNFDESDPMDNPSGDETIDLAFQIQPAAG